MIFLENDENEPQTKIECNFYIQVKKALNILKYNNFKVIIKIYSFHKLLKVKFIDQTELFKEKNLIKELKIVETTNIYGY